MLITIVLVTHDSSRWLPLFVEGLRGAQSAASGAVAVVVADSGSGDDSVAVASRLLPEAVVVACGNVGFGAAANRGVARAATEWVLLCNPDVTFPAEFFRRLMALDLLSRVKAGCIAPRLLNEDGSVQPSVGRFPTVMRIVVDQFRARERRKCTFPQPVAEMRVDWATGACLLLRREAFLGVGGFDEKFFLYAEELDLLKRMGEAGWEVSFAPAVEVTHHAPNALREPRPEVQLYAARGLLRFFAKHGGFVTLWGYRKLAFFGGRLPFSEAFASRKAIVGRATGP